MKEFRCRKCHKLLLKILLYNDEHDATFVATVDHDTGKEIVIEIKCPKCKNVVAVPGEQLEELLTGISDNLVFDSLGIK